MHVGRRQQGGPDRGPGGEPVDLRLLGRVVGRLLAQGAQTITDFDIANDVIKFNPALFANFAAAMTDASQSGTASALMGTLMFVFGGIAAPLAGLGGETMLKMSLAMTLCYLAALLIGLKKPRSVA